ncbi:unnamed protein product [Rotaria sp. Silwood2]|nr:unnamed protein product [Rotaria sp. Silwood2]
MQQVNAAREVLMDPKTREMYDRYGLEGMKTAMNNENFNFPGFSGSIFDLFNLFEHGNSSQGRSTVNKGKDIKHVLRVGGKGKSVDATDACCKAHNIQSRTNFLRCPLYSAFYSEDFRS